jgi:putative acetyltransferase
VLVEIGVEQHASDDVFEVIEAHRVFTLRHTPSEYVFSLDVDQILESDVTLVVLRVDGVAKSIGALRAVEEDHFEVKSMHTLESARGQGFARRVLAFLLELAKARGASRVSLETGAGPPFEPARLLYESLGFVECGPFGGYPAHELNCFMTLSFDC